MEAERYQLLVQLGAGSDGIAYHAHDLHGDELVELRVLSLARLDDTRWPTLAKRLRLAAGFQHPLALGIRGLYLDDNPPTVVLPRATQPSLAFSLRDPTTLTLAEVVDLGRQLIGVLSAAHRFGLTHGHLSPGTIRCNGAHQFRIDFSGIDTGETVALSPTLDPRWLDGLEVSCREPERKEAVGPDSATDIYSFGAILFWLLTGRAASPTDGGNGQVLTERFRDTPADEREIASLLAWLIQQSLSADPDERPLAREIEEHFATLVRSKNDTQGRERSPDALTPESIDQTLLSAHPQFGAATYLPERIGRFRVLEKLGQGGMGVVYRAEDTSDGTIVALKVALADLNRDAEAKRRFRKEARLLAQVRNPYVASLLEVNEDEGQLYLVMEYVPGRNLRQVLEERGPLDERTALAVLADAARALVDAHRRGIVHRDIKLENMVLVEQPGADGASSADSFRVKLLDFGLARKMDESESMQLTKTGVQVGTPLYMAPEQCLSGGRIDPRSDVYALGANLFHLLAGRPPFMGESIMSVLSQHCNEPLPSLAKLKPQLSDAVCRVVAKAMSKAADARYADAGELLQDLERLLRGEPTAINVHPRLPENDPRRVQQFEWTWELEASPEQLWPYVSNTERLNRAVGLPAVHFTVQPNPHGGGRRFGQFRKLSYLAAWEEHPFEWVEGRRMGVLREYNQGPFKWLVSRVELTQRAGGGTILTHQVRVEPLGLFGRLLAKIEVGVNARRGLDRVYRRMDAALTGKLGTPSAVDAFEPPADLSRSPRERLDRLLDALLTQGIDLAVVEALGDFLRHGASQEVARIRPLALAERLKLPAEQVVAACLHGAREGLFVILWDILCPICRIPAQVKDTLLALSQHSHCEACNRDFELDFANSVELIVRIHPGLRTVDTGTYCLGGPSHSSHVAAQVRLAPGERLELTLGLSEGSYRLRGPQLPFTVDFRVHPSARATRWELNLKRGPSAELPRTLKAGEQVLELTNEHGHETIVRIERTASRTDALTAARASSLPLFRKLFPDQVLASGQLISVTNITLLVTESEHASGLYKTMGDNQAFNVIHEHLRLLEEHIQRESGSVVKTIEEGLVAVFHDTVAAVRVACDLQRLIAEQPKGEGLRLRVGVHRGPALASTMHDQLEYFGTTVKVAMQLPSQGHEGEIILSQMVATDPQVAAWLHGRRIPNELFTAHLSGVSDCLVQRLMPAGVHARPENDSTTPILLAQGSLVERTRWAEQMYSRTRTAIEQFLQHLGQNSRFDDVGLNELRHELLRSALDFYHGEVSVAELASHSSPNVGDGTPQKAAQSSGFHAPCETPVF